MMAVNNLDLPWGMQMHYRRILLWDENTYSMALQSEITGTKSGSNCGTIEDAKILNRRNHV